jgi:hypothetical protein
VTLFPHFLDPPPPPCDMFYWPLLAKLPIKIVMWHFCSLPSPLKCHILFEWPLTCFCVLVFFCNKCTIKQFILLLLIQRNLIQFKQLNTFIWKVANLRLRLNVTMKLFSKFSWMISKDVCQPGREGDCGVNKDIWCSSSIQ